MIGLNASDGACNTERQQNVEHVVCSSKLILERLVILVGQAGDLIMRMLAASQAT